MSMENHYDAIILGGGPAGLTAGIYLSRAKLRTLIINEGTIGGQMILTHEIANYPGVEKTSGYMLSMTMKKQAESFGAVILSNKTVEQVDLNGKTKSVQLTGGQSYTARSVIFAQGGRSRTLGVPGEDELKGKGISYCATCDGDFFADKEIIVVGGGNSALEEAVSLTKYASRVTIVHKLNHFEAHKHAVEEATKHSKIDFIMESAITAFYGEERLTSVDIRDLKTGTVSNRKTDGVFVFIGYVPNTETLTGKLDLNQAGEIIVSGEMQTSVPGVFAAGDCTAKRYRQITTAVADGTIAALAAADYIEHSA